MFAIRSRALLVSFAAFLGFLPGRSEAVNRAPEFAALGCRATDPGGISGLRTNFGGMVCEAGDPDAVFIGTRIRSSQLTRGGRFQAGLLVRLWLVRRRPFTMRGQNFRYRKSLKQPKARSGLRIKSSRRLRTTDSAFRTKSFSSASRAYMGTVAAQFRMQMELLASATRE